VGLFKPIPVPIPAATFGAPGTGSPTLLPVRYQHQEQGNWCWAACGSMLIEFYAKPPKLQCDLASWLFSLPCCAQPIDSNCDNGAWPSQVYPNFGVSVAEVQNPLQMAEVVAELGAGRPVEVYYAWTGGGAHVALIVGIFPNGDYLVLDPWYGPGPRTEDAVLRGYGMGAWAMSYRTGAV
jgi:hypothetical protein